MVPNVVSALNTWLNWKHVVMSKIFALHSRGHHPPSSNLENNFEKFYFCLPQGRPRCTSFLPPGDILLFLASLFFLTSTYSSFDNFMNHPEFLRMKKNNSSFLERRFWKIQNPSQILQLRKAFVKPQFY